MDGELQQQNGNVHDELDLTIPSDDRDSFWNNLATVDDDNVDTTDEGYTGAASSSKRKRASKHSKRHRRYQTQQLEAVFEEFPHPDGHLRLDLAKKLGMGVQQVKFWFQNRRSAQKNWLEKQETKMLREENEALRAEHQAIRAALLKKTCPTCGGPTVPRQETPETQQLLLENARIKDEIFHKTSILNLVSGKAPIPMPASSYAQLKADLDINGPDNSPVMDAAAQGCVRGGCNRALVGRLLRAREEFMVMVKKDQTMWLPRLDGEVLDYQRYHNVMSPGILGHSPLGFAMNGTRDTGMVRGTGADVISILTDGARLCEAFPGIVGSVTAKKIAPFSAHNTLTQLMNANLLVLSPRIPTCKVLFVRQSHLIEPNVWAVVDVSVEDIWGQDSASSNTSTWIDAGAPMACRLLPSGCLIEDMKTGYCKVTWIVNAEYDTTEVPVLYHPLLRSGHALGARRWLVSLQRRAQYLALLRLDSSTYISKTLSPIPPDERNSVMELSQQMTACFCVTLCGAGPNGQAWGSVEEWCGTRGVGTKSFEVAVRVATLQTASDAQGGEAGLIISAATTVWLPGTPATHVLDYICDGDHRGEWDTFCHGAPVQQEDYVTAIQLPRYAVSVLRPKSGAGTMNRKLILQQVCADESCMLVAYAPVEEQSLKEAMHGVGSHARFSLLPSGFVILPYGHGDEQIPPVDAKRPSGSGKSHGTNGGCIVSVLFQTFLREPAPENLTTQTIENIGSLLSRSIMKIKEAVHANIVITA